MARVMGYVPQAHAPPFPFTVIDTVLMGRTAHCGALAAPGKNDRRIAAEALAMLDIGHLCDRPYTEVSGGERQLVLVARALAQQPRVLVMDEPTASLDFGHQVIVLDRVQRLADSGIALVMATHFPDHAFLCATKVLMLKDRSVAAVGGPEEVITESSLGSLYGVDVRIIDTGLGNGRQVKVCVPLTRRSIAPGAGLLESWRHQS
jgi:ABC-type cobalamin/Fe3+-siderophores transport system ATPase subunit